MGAPSSATSAAPAPGPAPQGGTGVAEDGAEILAVGIIWITFIAGVLEVLQRLRGSGAWPVPLVIYATLLPITLFFLVAAEFAGEGMGLGWLAVVLAPLPMILLARRVRRA